MNQEQNPKAMTYEAWRISFQSSESAARSAFSRAADLEAQVALHLQELRAYRLTVDNLEAVKVELLAALNARVDYGAMTGDDWVTDQARAAIASAAIARAEGGAA